MSSDNLGSFTDLSIVDTAEPSTNEKTASATPKENETTVVVKKSPSSASATLMTKRHKFRTGLPSSASDRNKVSIWSILKQCVDKELYRFTIPIVWNEPLTLLQRMAENMRYSNMQLDRAVTMDSPLDRMKYVAGFLVSCTSIHIARLSKPFNPLLGETYEYTCTENNYRICCEQVSHHPPVSAYYSESTQPTANPSVKKWKYYGSVNPIMKMNLMNGCVDAFPFGIQTVEFPEFGEVYTWHNLKVTAHNLVLGKLWFEYTGKAEIVNHKNNMKCTLEFKPYSWFSRQLNRCEGYVADGNENKLALLNGKWDECFYASNDVKQPAKFARLTEKLINKEVAETTSLTGGDIECVWRTPHANEDLRPESYNFSAFTFQLNELYEELLSKTETEVRCGEGDSQLVNRVAIGPIAPTDSRYRPDMRLYESGVVEEASEHKHRLEEKQREKQRRVEAGEMQPYVPLWFNRMAHEIVGDQETWTFNEKYWERNWSKCPDIY